MRRLLVVLSAAVMLTAACNVNVAGKQLSGHPPSYDVFAQFPTTIGLYPGSFVRQLGIDVGTVSQVRNEGGHVLVTMRITKKYHLAKEAKAILVGDSVLGERYVQFTPAYIGGDPLPPGSRLGLDRVAVPVETDAVLRSLNTVLRGINPTDVKQFTVNLAGVLQGEGAKLNTLIANAAGTVQILADKGNDLGQLNTTLAKLTAQLGTKDQALAKLIQDYDLLAQTLAADRGQLDGTITQLTNVTGQGAALLNANLSPIQQDVAALTSVGQMLDRNLPAVDVGLQYGPRLFSAAKRAYDPMHNWLPLNSQANPAETSAVLGASVRDALASLCRRLGAKQPGLATALSACGDPKSSFFNPIIGVLPTLLGSIPGQTGPAAGPKAGSTPVAAAGLVPAAAAAPATAAAAFANGVAAIPGLSDQQRQALSAGVDQPAPAAAPPPGPAGAAAVAALSSSPLQSVATSAHHHGRGILGGFVHWIGGLL